MALEVIIERVFKLHELIEERKTGTISDLSHALGLSKRQAYNYLNLLKKIGRGVKYDSEQDSYVYIKSENPLKNQSIRY